MLIVTNRVVARDPWALIQNRQEAVVKIPKNQDPEAHHNLKMLLKMVTAVRVQETLVLAVGL
jgi:hypothetical protein